MGIDDEISDLISRYPNEFGIIFNAFGEGWVRKEMKKCVGASAKTKIHPLAWKLFQPIDGNIDEVLLLSKFLSVFSADKKIGVLIDQLKNREEYDTAFSHLAIAYQFYKDAWKVTLEYDNRPNCVDLLVTKNGEVVYVECSQKMLPLEYPVDHGVLMGIMSRLTPPYFSIEAKLIFTGDGIEEEAINLIRDNAALITDEDKNEIVFKSDNFRVEMKKQKVEKIEDMKSKVSIQDERPIKTMAERLLKKIRTEHEQTKSELGIRVVALQILGRPNPSEWVLTLEEVHKRLLGLSSKPDAVFIFKKRWDGEHINLDIHAFLTTSERAREVLEPTSNFFEANEKLSCL